MRYIFLGGSRVASINGSTLLYYHDDHLGGTNVLTDSTGTLKEIIEYEPFGSESRHDKLGNSNEVAWYYFTGKKKDDETGLLFFGARYYDPSIGRFITPDTIVPYASDPQSFNRYTYARNNPVNLIDPTGHFWFIPFIIAAIHGAAIGAAVGAAAAAITGGNIGRGALFGAIGGGVFGGLSSAFNSFATFAMTGTTNVSLIGSAARTVGFLGGIVGGAGAGAAVAGYLGTDIGEGAGIGALSGGLFGGISQLPGTGWAGVGRVALAGVAGGGISELAGGKFIDGFIFASSIASADFIYRAILRSQGHDRGASMRTATKSGQPKLDQNGNLIDNKPLHADLDISQPGVPSNPAGTKVGFWEKFITGETSPVMNFVGKNVPGVQGLSLAHDVTGHFFTGALGGTANGLFLNFQTMPPVYGLNLVGSTINDSPALIGIYKANRREE